MNKYICDFDSETNIFSLHDIEEGIIIVITKDQLEYLMKFYNYCFEKHE